MKVSYCSILFILGLFLAGTRFGTAAAFSMNQQQLDVIHEQKTNNKSARRLLREVNTTTTSEYTATANDVMDLEEMDRLFFGLLIRCVKDSDCPATYPFCQNVKKEELEDQALWYEGLRSCYQCTDEDSSLCGSPTDMCVDGQCVMCATNADCSSNTNTSQCISGICSQCSFPDSLSEANPINWFENQPECGTVVPSCPQYGTFQSQCTQCVTRYDTDGQDTNCGVLNPVCTDEQYPDQQPVCRQCVTSSSCVSKSNKVCSSDNTCKGCNDSGDCDGQICHPTLKQCTSCTPSDTSACPSSTPFCAQLGTSQINSTCVQCITSADCSGNAVETYCSSNNTCVACEDGVPSSCASGVCLQGSCVSCISNADCQGTNTTTPYCNADVHVCQECVDGVAGQCPTGSICQNGSCVPGCLSDSDCDSTSPVCNVDTKTCVQCTASNTTFCQDPNPVCQESTGRCQGCVSDQDCANPTPKCVETVDGLTCMACGDSSDCPVDNPICKASLELNKCIQCEDSSQCNDPLLSKCSADNRCVSCLQNSDCPSNTPYCSTSFECVNCRDNQDCTSFGTGQCQNSTCVVQCSTNTDCTDPTLPICDAGVGKCVQCATSDECGGATPFCDKRPGTTFDQCVGCRYPGTDCPAESPICSNETNTCIQCLTNSDCGDPKNPICDQDLQVCVPCNAANPNTCSAPTSICDPDYRVCVECRNNGQCAAKDPLTPVCYNTTCVQCVSQTDCPQGSYCDVDALVCKQGCNDNSDCVQFPNQPICDVSSNQCVACTDSSQCGGTTTHCDLATNTCKECLVDQQCGPNAVCNPTTLSCQRCLTNDQCTSPNPYCIEDGELSRCAQCINDSQCEGTSVCLPGENRCVDCITDDSCPNGVCDTTSNTCTTCLSNTDCGATGQTRICDTSGPINACVQCTSSQTCASLSPKTPICDPTTQTCITCLLSTPYPANGCPSGSPVCTASVGGAPTCVMCTASDSGSCGGNTPYCDGSRNSCVSCLVDSHCTGINSKCRSGTCAPECRFDSDCQDPANSYCENNICVPPPQINTLISRVTSRFTCEVFFQNAFQRYYGRNPRCRWQPNGCCHCPACGCIFKDCSARNPSRSGPGGHFG